MNDAVLSFPVRKSVRLVIIKDLVRVLQNGINNLCLQAQVAKSIGTKQGRTQDDG